MTKLYPSEKVNNSIELENLPTQNFTQLVEGETKFDICDECLKELKKEGLKTNYGDK